MKQTHSLETITTFLASGQVITVATELDLVELVLTFSKNLLKIVTSCYQLWADGAQKPKFTGVNEDFEHRPTANSSCAVDLEQVLKTIKIG